MIWFVLFLFVKGGSAFALPTLYGNGQVSVVNRTNSDLITDSEDTRKFYVLPPSSANAKILGLHTVTANVGFCSELAKIQKYNLDTLDLMNKMKLKDQATKLQLDDLNRKLQLANEDLAKFAMANNLQDLIALDLRVNQIEKRLEDLYSKIKTCKAECDLFTQDIQDSMKAKSSLLQKRFDFTLANMAAANEFEKRKAIVVAIEKATQEVNASWKQLKADLADVYVEFLKMYDAHAKREGGRVGIAFDSHWVENLNQLRADNPNLHFEKTITKNANIRASGYSKSNLPFAGAVLAFDVGGMSAEGILSLESYPENFSGNVVLNLLGVCPALYPELFNLPNSFRVDQMNYGLTVGFQYPATIKYEVTVHYNMYKIYESIRRQGQSGGFFSTSTWSTHEEEEFFKDSFSVDWKVEDDRQIITDDEKMKINSDLRHQILSRLASQLVMSEPQLKDKLQLNTNPTGAIVLANSMSKICPAHVYCQGASLILNVLQAIIGSSSSEQKNHFIYNVDMKDRYSNEQMVLQPRLTTYR